jgi:hypothetical protein
MRQGYIDDGRGHNRNVYEKPAEQTMQERIHAGSASWVEAPTYLQGFMGGQSDEAERQYIQVNRSGGRQMRRNAAQVMD